MSYKPDIGTVISLNTGVDISTGTLFSIEVKKPSTTTVSWAGVLGADHYSVEHTIIVGDFTEAGTYTLQAKVTTPLGVWYGNSVTLVVKDTFS